MRELIANSEDVRMEHRYPDEGEKEENAQRKEGEGACVKKVGRGTAERKMQRAGEKQVEVGVRDAD